MALAIGEITNARARTHAIWAALEEAGDFYFNRRKARRSAAPVPYSGPQLWETGIRWGRVLMHSTMISADAIPIPIAARNYGAQESDGIGF